MSQQLQEAIIGRFISRGDAFAHQQENGAWYPARDAEQNLIPWSRDYLQAHLDGKMSLGHYLINPINNMVRCITFDIDWIKETDSTGKRQGFIPVSYDDSGLPAEYEVSDLREAWHDRANFHRTWMKCQMRTISHKIAAAVIEHLGIPCAVAYSGNKGLHVYGFTGPILASEARLAANLVMESLGTFALTRGSFEWHDTEPDIDKTLSNFSVEIFPKQDSVEADSFGNLVALPLGVNRKNPEDPKFFVDLRLAMNVLAPVDPLFALTTENPWADETSP